MRPFAFLASRIPPIRRALLALALFAGAQFAPAALAQNLVQNPFFFEGFAFYNTSGNVGNYYIPGGTPAAGLLGPNNTSNLSGLVINTPAGVAGVISQSILTSPGMLYTISFSASFDQKVGNDLAVSFADSVFSYNFQADPSKTGSQGPGVNDFQTFSFNATATGQSSDLTFTMNDGAVIVTGLDVEAAPAPAPGSGVLAFAALCLGLGARSWRKRAAAR